MSDFQSIVLPDQPLKDAIKLMGAGPGNMNIAGFAVVVDHDRRVLGVVTDGDVRRGLGLGRELPLDIPISQVATMTPFLIRHDLPRSEMRRQVFEEARDQGRSYLRYEKLVLVDADRKLVDVIRLSDLLDRSVEDKKIAVHGLGYVGLTLACTFASRGLSVVGVDIDKSLVQKLQRGIAPFFERGLDAMLQSQREAEKISFAVSVENQRADIHVVCVGTPLDRQNKPDLTAIREVSRAISKELGRGDLVVYRSTVPVGCTRTVVVPALEENGLKIGQDFSVAFAPERTIEGNALEELLTLPQIVGGYDPHSANEATDLFKTITNTIVEVESLEAAELVKLINNTYRDVAFAFANEVAELCDHSNIDAFRLIHAANDGYPRNQIPTPSPGVGGLCLSKDPFLYTYPMSGAERPKLGSASRAINSQGHHYVVRKLKEYCDRMGRSLPQLRILIIGIAFKGHPDTSDIRDSVALDLIEELPARENIRVMDHVVSREDLAELGVAVVENIEDGFDGIDAVLVMNNHSRNNTFNVTAALRLANRPTFFFDGWHLFDIAEIESQQGVCYATLGYMTPKEQIA